MGALPRALSAVLKERIRTGVAVRHIQALPNGFRIDTGRTGVLEARSVVLATQPHVAGMLLEKIDNSAAEAALTIPAPPIAVVFLGYLRNQVAHPLQGLGYLTASSEGRSVSGALFPSSMFADRAPSGHVALSAYVGGTRAGDLALASSKVLIDIVRDEFRDLLGATGEPQVARVKQWPRGLPQTCIGHQDRLDALTNAEHSLPGLFLTGNYFSGPGITACVTRALDAARRIDAHLQGMNAGTSASGGQQSGELRDAAGG